jgi:mannose/fructose-specific phosphotransferase system component IIA
MLRALLITHGDLGAALLQTASGIVGPTPGVEAISNKDQSREGLTRLIESKIAAWNGEQGLVLTDIHGGSCAQAATSGALLGRGAPPVITGVNLPMLVDFLVNRGTYTAAEMAARLIEKGRAGVRLLESPGAAKGEG